MPKPPPPFISALAHHASDPFRLLVESVVDYAIYMVDRAGHIASWNPGAERIYGYTTEEIVGRHFATVFAPDELASNRPKELWEQAVTSGHIEFECLRARKDGSQFWAMVTVSELNDHFGNRAGFSVVTRDLTERREAEVALMRERDLSNAILESLPGVYYIYDEHRRFLRWNARLEAVSGYSADEIRMLDPLDLFHPADRSRVADRIAEVFTEGISEVEADLLTKDGRRIPCYFNGVQTELAGKRYLLGMGIEVSATKEARDDLLRTTSLLRAVVEGTPDALFVKDQEGKYLLFHSATSRFGSQPTNEVLGKDDTALFDAESARVSMANDRRVMELNAAVREEERLAAAGATRVYEAIKAPYRDGDGNILGVIGISRDITERKLAEEAMRQQQVLLRIAGRIARLGGWTLDLASQEVTWSDEVCEIHEVPAGYQPPLEDALDFYPPEYREQVVHLVHECATKGTPFDFDFEMVTAKGRRCWVRSTGEAVRHESGEIVSLQGAFQDITDRKQAEAEQRSLAAQLATTLESITDGFMTLDHEYRFTYVNAQAERMTLRRREELIGVRLWEAFPETLDSTFERSYRRAMAEQVTLDFEEYFPPLAKWFGVRVYPSEKGLTIYFRDVTTSREAELALRASEARFRTVIQSSWDVFQLVEPDGRIAYESPAVTRVLGYQPEEMVGHNIVEFVHPDDLAGISQTVPEQLTSEGQQRTVVLRVRHRDGSWRWVESFEVNLLDHPDVQAIAVNYRDITERKQLEAERDRLLTRLQTQIDRMPLAYLLSDATFAYTQWNPTAERMFGFSESEVLGKHPFDLIVPAASQPMVATIFERLRAGSMDAHGESENNTKSGKRIICEWHNTPLLDNNGAFIGLMSLANDITERKGLELQLLQAQKMEAVGRLAGGVAHDFNNLLTVISGNSELVLGSPAVDPDIRESVVSIREAGERAASLTQQLLSFSRQTLLQPKVLDLNGVVSQTATMLRRLIGEDIQFTTALDPELSPVKVDPGQLDQVLMNLAVNARDAMPRGGKLTIETHNVVLSDEYAASHLAAKAGEHVLLAITDNGEGMTPEVMRRIFDPFFTTKEVGQGTGLGLAMVFGIVQQSGGSIDVSSEPGRGTTFKIYLPAVSEPLSGRAGTDAEASLRGTETLLLVEDDELVRNLAVKSLTLQGYRVLTAADGKEAVGIVESHRGPLDLILTDVVMPILSGPAMIEQLRPRIPGVRVLFMSGYTDDAVIRHGLIEAETEFIQKPFTPTGLARKVRQVLDAKRAPAD